MVFQYMIKLICAKTKGFDRSTSYSLVPLIRLTRSINANQSSHHNLDRLPDVGLIARDQKRIPTSKIDNMASGIRSCGIEGLR